MGLIEVHVAEDDDLFDHVLGEDVVFDGCGEEEAFEDGDEIGGHCPVVFDDC